MGMGLWVRVTEGKTSGAFSNAFLKKQETGHGERMPAPAPAKYDVLHVAASA